MSVQLTPKIHLLVQKYSKHSHEELQTMIVALPTDFGDPALGFRDRAKDYGPDCSMECIYFIELPGDLGRDWGICANPVSPRYEMLTFEHMGCKEFTGENT